MNDSKILLIVEDDPDISYVVSMVLEMDGYIVKKAANGAEALNLIHEQGLPKLILLDMRMPVMDGWQFASEFYASYGHPIPIVVMTAAGDSGKRGADVQADDCIGKPFELSVLQTTVRQALEKFEKAKAA